MDLHRYHRGITLMELVIVVAIVAILGAIAIPSYNDYVTETRRADGQVALLDLANRMDRFFTENNTYVGATLAGLGMPTTSSEGFYNLAITNATGTAYTIQATPTGAQASQDTNCASLTYNQLGQKGNTGPGTAADCW